MTDDLALVGNFARAPKQKHDVLTDVLISPVHRGFVVRQSYQSGAPKTFAFSDYAALVNHLWTVLGKTSST